MDNRVRSSLLEGIRDYHNLLVHLQQVLDEIKIPVVRSGGGLSFAGFSIQVSSESPVDWIGYSILSPDRLTYQIRDRNLPEGCPLSDLVATKPGEYERYFIFSDRCFFDLNEKEQMTLIRQFIQETIEYLLNLPDQGESTTDNGIPIISR